MLKKIIKFLIRHKIVSLVVAVVIVFGGYFLYTSLGGSAKETRYILSTVERGTISKTVSATGQISASDKLDIKPSVSGNITKAYVADGQAVKAGDLLFQIDDQDAQKSVKDAVANLENAKISLAKLQQGLTAQELANVELQVESAENNLTDAKNNLEIVKNKATQDLSDDYSDSRNILQSTYNTVNDILNRQVNSMFINNGTELSFLTSNSQAQVDVMSKRMQSFSILEKLKNFSDNLPADESGVDAALSQTADSLVVVQNFLNSLSLALNSGIVSGSITQSTIDGYKSTASSARNSVISAKSSISSQQRAIADQRITNSNNILTAENKIISSQNSLSQAKNNFESQTASADALDVRAKQIAVNQAATALANAQAKLADYSIRATFDGIVTDIVNVSGYTASASTVLATVITKQQIADVSLNEVDAANAKVGQKATLTFDAVEDLTITGKVIQIDTIGTVSSGVVSYGAKIALDTQDERVKPGMSVSADIIVDAKADVLLISNAAIKTSGVTSYVEAVNGVTSSTPTASDGSVIAPSAPTKITIEVGISNDDYTEVISGLSEGDLIVEKTVITTLSSANTETKSLMQLFGGGGNRSGSSSIKNSSSNKSSGSTSGSGAMSGSIDAGGPPPGM